MSFPLYGTIKNPEKLCFQGRDHPRRGVMLSAEPCTAPHRDAEHRMRWRCRCRVLGSPTSTGTHGDPQRRGGSRGAGVGWLCIQQPAPATSFSLLAAVFQGSVSFPNPFPLPSPAPFGTGERGCHRALSPGNPDPFGPPGAPTEPSPSPGLIFAIETAFG